ncbi:hypothetical protein FVE85_7800 [Porphyridium purpureum]|uniref:Transmembrane protein n=1 Tax=Porphyridium purpureum TaxID=35688 RepID=A0A5J4YJ07_PORPP|nr:hypothetical protein FVE85_7800 [Porphyridium purpureum]|eukprot:POR1879..scf210_14
MEAAFACSRLCNAPRVTTHQAHSVACSRGARTVALRRPRVEGRARVRSFGYTRSGSRAHVALEASGPDVDAAASAAVVGSTSVENWIVLLVCASLLLVWWVSVVPAERQRLAKRKRQKGADVRTYIEKLEASGKNERTLEKWLYGEWLQKREKQRQRQQRLDRSSGDADGSQSDLD